MSTSEAISKGSAQPRGEYKKLAECDQIGCDFGHTVGRNLEAGYDHEHHRAERDCEQGAEWREVAGSNGVLSAAKRDHDREDHQDRDRSGVDE